MRYCVDTWYLHELYCEIPKATEIFRQCRKGKDYLVFPSVVLTEYRNWCIRRGIPKVAI